MWAVNTNVLASIHQVFLVVLLGMINQIPPHIIEGSNNRFLLGLLRYDMPPKKRFLDQTKLKHVYKIVV